MDYKLPKLPYKYDELEPFIDAETMEIHYTKHHQAYIDKLNAVLKKYPGISERPLEELLGNLADLEMEEADRKTLQNNGGGHANHSLYWEIMDPNKTPDKELIKQLEDKYGSVNDFYEELTAAAMGQFGSGWAWLVRTPTSELDIYSTANQDSPLSRGDIPVLGVDVWEHAYYLKYQNKRAEYLEAFRNVIKLVRNS